MYVVSRPPLTFWMVFVHIFLTIYILKNIQKSSHQSISFSDFKNNLLHILSTSVDSGSIFLTGAVFFVFLMCKLMFGNANAVIALKSVFFPFSFWVCGVILAIYLLLLCWIRLIKGNWNQTSLLLFISETLSFGFVLTFFSFL